MPTIDPAAFDRMAQSMGMNRRDPAAIRRRLEWLEMLLERAITVPGTRMGVGLDSVLGMVPVMGDVVSACMGAYLVWEGRNLGMSRWQLARMAGRIGVDTAIGAVPFVGDAFDFVYRSNTKNLRAIKRHLDRHHPAGATLDATPTRPLL